MSGHFNYARIDLGLIAEHVVRAVQNFVEQQKNPVAYIEERHSLNVILHELMCGADQQTCQILEQTASLLI